MTSLSKTYYVSSKRGNDSNDGLNCETAFASLFAINHSSLKPGDRVFAGAWQRILWTVPSYY